MDYKPTRDIIMHCLQDGRPRSIREIAKITKLSVGQIWNAFMLAWKKGLILRTASAVYEAERVNKRRGGVSHHIRPYHLYMKAKGGEDPTVASTRVSKNLEKEHVQTLLLTACQEGLRLQARRRIETEESKTTKDDFSVKNS